VFSFLEIYPNVLWWGKGLGAMPDSDLEEYHLLYPLDLLNNIEQQAFEHYAPWLIHALSTCTALPPSNPTRTLQLADYGCSEGKNSLLSFSTLKAAFEEAGVYGKASSSNPLLSGPPFIVLSRC
jgi:hypothetical protein